MIVIRTAKELVSALALPLDSYVLLRLTVHRDRLLEYDEYTLEELALFIIVQPGDTLDSVNVASGVLLLKDRTFHFTAEAIDRQGDWVEALFILSDDGFGLVLFVPLCTDTDPDLLSALRAVEPEITLPTAH